MGRDGDSVEGPEPHKPSSWVGQTLPGQSGLCPVSRVPSTHRMLWCHSRYSVTKGGLLCLCRNIPCPLQSARGCQRFLQSLSCLSVLEKLFCHCQAAKCGKKPLSPTCSMSSSEEGDENPAQIEPLGEIKLLVMICIGIWLQHWE